MAYWSCSTASLKPSLPFLHHYQTRHEIPSSPSNFPLLTDTINLGNRYLRKYPVKFRCWSSNSYTFVSESEYETEEYYSEEEDNEGSTSMPPSANGTPPPVRQRRRRYRKLYPGEKKGITEEMRFVVMKLRNSGKKKEKKSSEDDKGEQENKGEEQVVEEKEAAVDVEEGNRIDNEGTWQPSIEGFLKYLVDSKLVFSTIERIVDESSDVSYVYFRKTGLERTDSLSRDLEWFSQQGNVIPQPSNPGVAYTRYLEELAEKSPPLFLCHFYNIYFSHIAGGQVIAKQVSEKIFEGRQLDFYKWEGDAEELLKGVREKLNALGEHWSRDEKNRCLKEATKAFRFLGQIVRLIIL